MLRQCGTQKKTYFRVAEVEVYFNDDEVHKDTFTHGQDMQRESGKWYFHKQGNSYKSGTYRGLDLAFGKGKKAAGGILMRSLIPTTVF